MLFNFYHRIAIKTSFLTWKGNNFIITLTPIQSYEHASHCYQMIARKLLFDLKSQSDQLIQFRNSKTPLN